jgi:hypothetical protein
MLFERISNNLKEALKARNEEELGVLRFLKSALKNEEIAKKHTLTEDEEIAVLDRQAKQREDSISQYEKAGRGDLAQKEQRELEIINRYRPAKMGEDEVREVVKGVVKSHNLADFGQVMKEVMIKLKGKADGRLVSEIVKSELTK